MNLYASARLIPGLLTTVLAGWVLLRFLLGKEKRPFAEEMALSYGLGMAAFGFEFVLFWFLGITPSLLYMLLPWLIIYVVTKIFSADHRRFNADYRRFASKGISLSEILLFSGIALEAALSFFRALIKPIESFDSVAIYAIRAKIIHLAGGIPPNFFTEITKVYPNSGHPIMLPLFEAWVYKILGNFDDFAVKIIFPLFFTAAIVLFYFALRDFLKRREALLFTFLLAAIPQFNRFSAIGYADFPLAFYFTAGSIYLFRWLKKKNNRHLVISAILFGISCWIKMEGYALALCAAAVVLIAAFTDSKIKKNPAGIWIFFLIILIIGAFWLLLVNISGLENNVFKFKSFGPCRFASSLFNLDRLPRIVYEFQKQFTGVKKWNIIWIILLTLAALNIRDIFRKDIKYMTYLLFLVMAAYAYSFLLIPLRPGEPINIYLSTTISRLFIHFAPLAVYWVAYLCKEKKYI